MNHPFSKRAACVLLIAAMLLGLTSCGFIVFRDEEGQSTGNAVTEQTNPPTTSNANETSTPASVPQKPLGEQARDRLAALPDRDFEGVPVIIATVDDKTICPMDTDNDVTVASRADVKRAVEEKFGVTVISNACTAETIMAEAKQAINSGMYYADLMAIPQSMVGSFYASGLLGNMYTLPFLNTKAEYYHAGIIESAHAGDTLLAVSGAANFNPEYLRGIYFNREKVKACVSEDLYELVRGGSWTWDKLREITIAAKSNLDGVSGLGSYFNNADLIDLAATSHGIAYTSTAKNSVPTVNFFASSPMKDRAAAAVDAMYHILYQDRAMLKEDGDGARAVFTADSLLFHIDGLDYITEIADSKVEWGILPLPKYDKDQSEYLSPLSSDAPVFCTPANLTGVETPGLILEGLNIASAGYVQEVYMNERIHYSLRDSASIEMLDIICKGVCTDFAHMFASGFTNLANATYKAVNNAVVSRASLDSLYRSYSGAANRELAAKIKLSE